jgi:hypothetical protein
MKQKPKQESCCTPIGQIKRYVDYKGCNRKPKKDETKYLLSTKTNKNRLLEDVKQEEENNKYSKEDMMFAYEQGARLALISQSSLALQKGEFPTPKEWFEQFKNK